jgi:hypothetical protein
MFSKGQITDKIWKGTLEDFNVKSPLIDSNTNAAKRLFVAPNLFNKESKLTENSERHFDIILKTSYKDVDSILIQLPHGYTVESLPKDISLKSKFGSYSISFKVKDNIIEVLRIRETNRRLYIRQEITSSW